MNKTELKASSLRMFNNVHKDNATKDELSRCVKVCNGAYMASSGEQLSSNIVDEVCTELNQELITIGDTVKHVHGRNGTGLIVAVQGGCNRLYEIDFGLEFISLLPSQDIERV